MNPNKTDHQHRHGVKSVALLWFALFLAAIHGLAGGSSMLRLARIAADGPAGVTSQYAGGGHKTLIQQRNIAIADWQNLRLLPAQAGGDADPAVLPAEIRAMQTEGRHVLSASLETSSYSAAPRGFSARAPPALL
jgi:hypothetical protein